MFARTVIVLRWSPVFLPVFLPVFGGGAGSQAGLGVQTGAHEMAIKGIIVIVWSVYVL